MINEIAIPQNTFVYKLGEKTLLQKTLTVFAGSVLLHWISTKLAKIVWVFKYSTTNNAQCVQHDITSSSEKTSDFDGPVQ